jgi:hypothetical protein
MTEMAMPADQVLFPAGEEVVNELGADADEHAVLTAIEEITRA